MTHSSGQIVLVSHLPCVRMADEAASFLGGRAELQRLPWDQYEVLTAGAFDREKEYVTGDPVVLFAQSSTSLFDRVEGAKSGLFEAKAPSDDVSILQYLPCPTCIAWGLDTTFVAWATLSLAKPLSGFIKPRHSTMFLVAQGDKVFANSDSNVDGIQLQGDADHEYFYAEKFCASLLTRKDIAYADELLSLLEPIYRTPALAGALQSLLASQDAALGRVEHALLCIISLEELLLEGQTHSLRKSFTGRLAALVPQQMRDQISEGDIKQLYDLRSDFLHGRSDELPPIDDKVLALAPAFLSAAIRTLATAVRDGADLATIVDSGVAGLSCIASQDPWQSLEEFRPDNRISGYRHSLVTSMTSRMFASEKSTLVWAPLLGLEVPAEGTLIGGTDRNALLPLDFAELEELEDRLIRLDFMADLSSKIRLGLIEDKGRACLMVPVKNGAMPDLQGRDPIDYPTVRAFVIAMRTLGFSGFIDPLLLGEFLYHEKLRLRIPTVYRQTLINKHFDSFDQPTPEQLEQASALRDVVLRISHDYPGTDNLLNLLREAHFHPVVDKAVRARLCFAFIDGVIGRLKGDDIAGQVATIGQRVAPGDVGRWFSDDARRLRNRLAHSGDNDISPEDFAKLLSFSNRLCFTLLDYLAGSSEGDVVSVKAFRKLLTTEMQGDPSNAN